MVLGAVLVLAALSLFLWNRQENQQAKAAVQRILPHVIERIEAPPTLSDDAPNETAAPSYPNPYDPTMTEVEIDGYAYIGYLSIPSLELELPVMSQWDDARLKIAPCRYVGSTKTDDLVICAHNYDWHFWYIRNLTPGDAVYFTDMDGQLWQYAVETVEILAPTDVLEMTADDFDLTLFTCTYGGATRVTVRCERVEDTGISAWPSGSHGAENHERSGVLWNTRAAYRIFLPLRRKKRIERQRGFPL